MGKSTAWRYLYISSSRVLVPSLTKFSEIVQQFGLKKSKCDHSVFYRQSKAGIIILEIHYPRSLC